MTRFALALLALLGLTSLASAQTMVARVVASCGAQSLNAGTPFTLTIDTSGNLCSGTVAISGTPNVNVAQIGGTAVVADPCQAVAKTSVAISQATNTKLFSQVSAKKNYICSVMIVGADAENISLVEGTGSTCGTSTAAIIGGTTAAAGPNLAANGGFSMGSGVASVAAGANANFDVCLFQSGAGRVAGVLTYVQQ